MTKSTGNCGIFTEEILNRKLHFLCSVQSVRLVIFFKKVLKNILLVHVNVDDKARRIAITAAQLIREKIRNLKLSLGSYPNKDDITNSIHFCLIYFQRLSKVLDTVKRLAQSSPSPLLNVMPSLKKLCQAVLSMNEQANLQPTSNKGAGCPSLTMFAIDCS